MDGFKGDMMMGLVAVDRRVADVLVSQGDFTSVEPAHSTLFEHGRLVCKTSVEDEESLVCH